MWGFALSDDGGLTYIPIEEPEKWDEVLFTQKRGPEGDEPWIDGADFVFTSTLTFVGKGARILKLAYDNYYIDADVRIRITYTGCNYDFDGFVDFSDYNENPYCGQPCGYETVTVRIYKSGFSQLFKNRIDTAVNLASQTGLDGNEIVGKEGFELKLHSKEILYTSSWKINEFLNDYSFTSIPDIVSHTPPLEIISQELEETLQPGGYDATQPLFYSGFSYPPGVSLRRIYIFGRLKFTSTSTAASPKVEIRLTIRNAETLAVRESIVLHEQPYVSGVANIDYIIPADTYVELLAGENLFLNILTQPATGSTSGAVTMLWDREASTLTFSENSIITPSTVKVYSVYEAFSKICESITGNSNCFSSDFFSTGCGAYLTITNGLNIRKMLDKEGNLFPVSTSFKDLYDAMDAIFCLGMRIEKTAEGELVRVEQRSFFYAQEVAQRYPFVPDINMTPDLTHVYNELEIGYAKWQTEDVNGLDEFNSKRLYSLPVKNVKKKLTRLCSFIASGYMIEQTRRQQFKEKPTSDYGTDNDMFIIATNRVEVNTNVYDINPAGEPITATYQPGTVSERDELFTDIQNLFSPATSFNLRLSPARNARYHYALLKVSLYKKTPLITFRSGTGNYQMISIQTDECNPAMGAVAENGHITDSEVHPDYVNALYVPETIDFVVGADSEKGYFSFDDFLEAVANPTLTYQASCVEDEHLGGYIKTLNYRPNKEGGFGEFTLQKK